MNAAQCRMARAALQMGNRELAARAKVSPTTISKFEAGEDLKPRTVEAIQEALEEAGVIFLSAGEDMPGGPGVRLRETDRS